MENKTALDTSICVAILKGKQEIIEAVNSIQGTVSLATITVYELMLRENNLEAVAAFVQQFEIFPFDLRAAEEASSIEKALKKGGNLIDKPDILIAATAIVNNCTLATLNVKDFSRIKGLKLVKIHE